VSKPPNDAYAEHVRLLDMLEGEYQRMRDVNAQVSSDGLRRIRSLRQELDRAQEQSSTNAFGVTFEVVRTVFAGIAREVVRWLIETSICWLRPYWAWCLLYDHRRCRSHAARVRWAQAG
jgi:hypothetical protein